ncbi:MAG TPA: hypothetical protein VK463_06485 [Desulfomonilaceae bacterium]|nr:hypothetical protein [Desulfomonilaceae bacterium]
MKKVFFAAIFLLIVNFSGMALAQTIEMAATCDEAQKRLAELIKKPDVTDVQKIKEALGLDIFDSCATTDGRIVCYQCLDKDQNLRTIQLLQKTDAKGFEVLGYGCRCRDKK